MPTGVYIHKPLTKEHKRNISEALAGKKHSEEHKRKLSLAQKGKNHPRHYGKNHPNWAGGRYRCNGYVYILKPSHPSCNKQGYVREHRLVVEKHIGRYLTKKEVVHHINEVVDDNRIENLILFKSAVYHTWFHRKKGNYPNGIIFDGRKLNHSICPPK